MKLWRRICIVLLVVVTVGGVVGYAVTHRITFENTAYGGVPTLLELGTETCPPCRQIAPVLSRLRNKYEKEINVQYHDINTPDGREYDAKYGVKVTPTLVFLDAEGKEVLRMEGFRSDAQLELEFIRLGWTS